MEWVTNGVGVADKVSSALGRTVRLPGLDVEGMAGAGSASGAVLLALLWLRAALVRPFLHRTRRVQEALHRFLHAATAEDKQDALKSNTLATKWKSQQS